MDMKEWLLPFWQIFERLFYAILGSFLFICIAIVIYFLILKILGTHGYWSHARVIAIVSGIAGGCISFAFPKFMEKLFKLVYSMW